MPPASPALLACLQLDPPGLRVWKAIPVSRCPVTELRWEGSVGPVQSETARVRSPLGVKWGSSRGGLSLSDLALTFTPVATTPLPFASAVRERDR